MKYLSALLFILFTTNIMAQTECVCCTESHKQFDFWVGEWIVRDTLGNTVGENRIKKIEDNCVLQEQWKGAGGGTGTSMNYYDSSDATWNQLWVDNRGRPLKLQGRFTSGKMVLKSELQKGQQVAFYYNQISWTPNEDGTVTQLWEIFDKDGKLLQTAFKGIYHKKN